MKKNKGQISLYDFMIGVLLFLVGFTALNAVWTSNYNNALASLSLSEMEFKALQALNALLKTRGYPENWNPENVEVIGLAGEKNSLKENKVNSFSSMDYSTAREKLKLSAYDFRFELDAVGEENDVSIGSEPGEDQQTINLKRVVEFKGGKAIVYFKVFQ